MSTISARVPARLHDALIVRANERRLSVSAYIKHLLVCRLR